MKSNFDYVGKRIQEARKKKGLTQKQLAQEVGCSPKNISAIENGDRLPGTKFLVMIADELNVSLDIFFDRKVV